MTARYGLPDHLIEPTAYAVIVAWKAATKTSPDRTEEFEGRPLHTLKGLWRVRVRNGWHADLLSAEDARELLRVVSDGIKINSEWLGSIDMVFFENAFPNAIDLDLKAEEVLMTLQDIASSSGSVAA